ncbi:hypothetical protein PHLCEN_2v2683 [Hermanssonia centrifuga]|uniref:Uncharacterized protein n=1 Tax=Hermanssonia centrifuga TaxID=98765 RepID=A0A2R6RII7_9APHY|nr:hypothetical protein PHLCEN_2v2683 [Hermanssonia centrifuga]
MGPVLPEIEAEDEAAAGGVEKAEGGRMVETIENPWADRLERRLAASAGSKVRVSDGNVVVKGKGGRVIVTVTISTLSVASAGVEVDDKEVAVPMSTETMLFDCTACVGKATVLLVLFAIIPPPTPAICMSDRADA